MYSNARQLAREYLLIEFVTITYFLLLMIIYYFQIGLHSYLYIETGNAVVIQMNKIVCKEVPANFLSLGFNRESTGLSLHWTRSKNNQFIHYQQYTFILYSFLNRF